MIFDVKLSQQSDEIKGRIQLSGDPAFNLECACSVVQSIAETHGVSLKQVLEDLWRVAQSGQAS